jgi:hypothetical protein
MHESSYGAATVHAALLLADRKARSSKRQQARALPGARHNVHASQSSQLKATGAANHQ